MIQIPDVFVRGTISREGERGAQWLAMLPDLVATLLERWACVADGPVMHGEIGVIVPVLRGQQRAVVKVSFPHPGNTWEPAALEVWNGNAAVRLYEREDGHFAMLLERAGSGSLADLEDNDVVVRVAGQLTKRLAIPAPLGLPRLREQMVQCEQYLKRGAADYPQALPQPIVDQATATIRELGHDQPDVVIHGDLHARNILRADREPWLAVDPKGLAGDPAYDGGTFLKTYVLALLDEDNFDRALLRYLKVFAESAELDVERVRRWAQVRAVESAFWRRRHHFARAAGNTSPHQLTQLADHLAHALR